MSLNEFQSRLSNSVREPWKESRLVGRTLDARDELYKLLRQSVHLQSDGRGGECISALLMGPSGVGKTLVVRSALEKLESEGTQVISITLHGRNCSDDKSSMRQIFSQFQRYLVERSNMDSFSQVNFRTGTLSEWCERLQRLLEECARSDYMVIITLEDFESFCHSKAKQSLLYNLFDLMHAKEARFVVIGITARPDAPELLEKRIKSRFQLRKIVLSPPDNIDEVIDVVKAALVPEFSTNELKPTVSSKNRRTPVKKAVSVDATVVETLDSKELRREWSFYRDLGYSLKQFTTAAVSALIKTESLSAVHQNLLDSIKTLGYTSAGEVGVMISLLSSLTQRDHMVLIGLLKLHQYEKRPKCFMNILKEIGSFEKTSACSQICKHSKRAYWHAFRGLVQRGLIETIDFGGVSAALAPPPMFARCKLSILESYRTLLISKTSTNDKLKLLPAAIIQWACETRLVNEGM